MKKLFTNFLIPIFFVSALQASQWQLSYGNPALKKYFSNVNTDDRSNLIRSLKEINFHDWLKKAKKDVTAAHALLKMNQDFAGIAAYQAHQSVEKSLKAYLFFQHQNIVKTHDLNLLLDRCMKFDLEFFKFSKEAKTLNPFAVITRYPDDQYVEVSVQEAEDLVKIAQMIFDFVSQKIEKSVT
jgi:HEPN domain-containing protein